MALSNRSSKVIQEWLGECQAEQLRRYIQLFFPTPLSLNSLLQLSQDDQVPWAMRLKIHRLVRYMTQKAETRAFQLIGGR